ncbi:MAG: CsgG/HfaB family protein [Candidatus Zixiibacteriota bacterium]
MQKNLAKLSLAGQYLLLSIFLFLFSVNGFAQAEKTIAEVLAKSYKLYALTEFEEAIKISEELLTRPDLMQKDSVAIYEMLGVCNYAKGQEYINKSFDYLNKIAAIGPCVNPLPQEFWPKELCNRWYSVTKASSVLNCSSTNPSATTIAFLPFDNYSMGDYQEKLGLFSNALAEFFSHDFRKISKLDVVERNKMDYLLDELKRTEAGITSDAAAIRLGKMLGAKLMVFGTISQIDDRTARMVARVVEVETSRIVASVDEEGAPNFNKMEKTLVERLAKELEVLTDESPKDLLQQGGTGSLDALYYYSVGLDQMDKYDYKKAYENFKKAFELDPSFVEAKQKMDTYGPLVG